MAGLRLSYHHYAILQLLASVERAFLEKQQALVNLRNAALRSYTSSSRVAKQCCEVENKEYNSRFNAEVSKQVT